MGRATREWGEGSIYHIYARGSNRQPIFLEQGDYFDFSGLFGAAVTKHRVQCFAWAFMPNHWHGLVRSPEAGLSTFVKELNHRHALRFNRRYARTAHVFCNRFGAVLQETHEQFLTTLRYVLRNPVAAGLSPTIEDARWTSYRATVGLIPAAPFLMVSEILDLFGPTGPAAIASFSAFISTP